MDNKILSESVGMLDVNCYLVPGSDGMLYIIDPGSEADKIKKRMDKLSFKEAFILLTHAHVDHISGAGELMQLCPSIKGLYLHPDDLGLYKSPNSHLMPYVPPATNLPEPVKNVDFKDFSVMHTPGHSRGGVCYYFPSLPALFSGDTLFRMSIGRTDFPGGDATQLIRSITGTLFSLPDDLKVYPGHGEPTTIGFEKENNPYVSSGDMV